MTQIHPTALVDPAAELAEGVVVGAYSIIGPHVRVGAATEIGPHCLRGETVVVFLSEKQPRWADTLQALATLRARQANLFAVVFDQASFLPEGAPSGPLTDHTQITAALLELGAYCLTVRRGDDLVRLFNA